MRDIFKYEKGSWYPHMKPRDVEIWERFITKFPDEYSECQYDFDVGDPPPFNTLWEGGEDKNQDALYRLKIDVVGYKAGKFDVIEIKPDANPATIGQVLSYKALYERDEDLRGPVGGVIITDRLRPNMDWLCKEADVRLFVV